MGERREQLRDVGILFLRLGMGIAMAGHGYGKLFSDRMQGFIDGVSKLGLPFGQPATLAHIAAWSEFGGGILIVIGLLTRGSALMILGTMCVAFFVAHGDDPWNVKELAFTYLIMSLTLLLAGPGRFSLDAAVELAFKHGRGGGK